MFVRVLNTSMHWFRIFLFYFKSTSVMEEVRQKNLVFQTTQYYNLTIRSLFINAPDASRKFWFAKPILTH